MPQEITILKAPASLRKALHSQYLCLFRSNNLSGGENWYAENSLVELARQIDTEGTMDWSYIEQELAENDIWHTS